MTGGPLLAVAQDAGGANAIAPVVARWLASGAAAHVVVTGPAARVFEARGLQAHAAPVFDSDMTALRREAADILEHVHPALVLAGTSWGNTLDKAMTVEAASRGIPTLAVIDAWGYYRERFSDIDQLGASLRYLPDRIAIMDDTSRDEAVRLGLPASRLVVTGQPHFDDFPERVAAARDAADRLRAETRAAAPLVVFASERFARDFGEGTPWYRGYTEREAWAGLRAAADGLAEPVTLVVKLHPQEEGWVDDGPAIVWRDVPPLVALAAADVIVGMTSTLLFEAALAGKPTISFQPGTRPAVESVSLRLGLTPMTRTVPQLQQALADALRRPGAAAAVNPWSAGDAAGAVVQVLRALRLVPASEGAR